MTLIDFMHEHYIITILAVWAICAVPVRIVRAWRGLRDTND